MEAPPSPFDFIRSMPQLYMGWEEVHMLQKRREAVAGYLFMTPWILGLFCFTLIPMVMSLYYSFTSFDMLNAPVWVGVRNYVQLFTKDAKFMKSLGVTFQFVFIGVPLQLAFSLLLAICFKKDRIGIRFYRASYYLPSLFGGSVAVSVLWRQLFNKTGLINQVLSLFGIVGKNMISKPSTAIGTLNFFQVLQFGATMVIFLASLKQIPEDYYEAATIDGAGKIRQFFQITLPLLTPMVFFNIVMQFINAFQSFTSAYIISGGTGSPLNSTLFYSLYLYLKAFREFQMGYASAMAWILLVIIGAITGLMFAFANKWVYYD